MFTIRTVLHATDFWEPASHAMTIAADLATKYGAKLILLHVWQEPIVIAGGAEPVPMIEPGAHLRDDAQAKLLALRPAAPTVEHLFIEGDPAEAIVRVAREQNADLVVLGTHGRTGLERFLLGSVAEQVIRRAHCPVLAVKKPG